MAKRRKQNRTTLTTVPAPSLHSTNQHKWHILDQEALSPILKVVLLEAFYRCRTRGFNIYQNPHRFLIGRERGDTVVEYLNTKM